VKGSEYDNFRKNTFYVKTSKENIKGEWILTDKELDKEIKEVNNYISEKVLNDPVTQQERLVKLCQYIGWLPELKAQSQLLLEKAIGKATEKYLPKGYQWTILNNLVKADVAEENARFTEVERIGSAISHQIDALRTLVSFAKEEMKNS
jgi:hypothetical protein